MGKESLKEKNVGGETYARLQVDQRLLIKSTLEGKDAFEYYHPLKKEKVLTTKPIEGIMIGEATTLTSFDSKYGARGGEYRSSYYLFNLDRIVIFDPSGQKVFMGTKDEIQSWAVSKNLEKFKSKKHLFVVTKLGSVIDITTNMTVHIAQNGLFTKDTWNEYFVKLTPDHYYPAPPEGVTNSVTLNKKAEGLLGPLAAKNNPKFALMEKGNLITDELWEAYGAQAPTDMYNKWNAEHTKSGSGKTNDAPEHANDAPENENFTEGIAESARQQHAEQNPDKSGVTHQADGNTVYGGKNPTTAHIPDPLEDDLPF